MVLTSRRTDLNFTLSSSLSSLSTSISYNVAVCASVLYRRLTILYVNNPEIVYYNNNAKGRAPKYFSAGMIISILVYQTQPDNYYCADQLLSLIPRPLVEGKGKD